ncbi:MAG: hybrid sensor histidine kinase/response regulator [Anaerolineae bacterium]
MTASTAGSPSRLGAWLIVEVAAVLLTVASLLLVALSAGSWFGMAYDGMSWSTPSYQVLEVSPNSPGDLAGIVPGDRIIAIDGVAVSERFPLYPGGPGTAAEMTLARGSHALVVTLTLGHAPARFLVPRLLVLIVAILFSILSFAFSLGDRRSQSSVTFLIFYQLLSVVISSGSVSSLQLPWAVRVFYVGLCLLIPATCHMASFFPEARPERWLHRLRLGLSIAGGAAALVFIAAPLQSLYASRGGTSPGQVVLMVLLFSVIGSLSLIVSSFRRAKDAVSKAAIRVSVLGLAIAVLPVVSLYLVPRLIIGRPLASAEATMLSLAALPLYHGFGVTRRRFGALERFLPPVSAAVLSGTIFIAVLIASIGAVRALWPGGGEASLYAGVVLGAGLLAFTNVSVISGARRMVHHAFFGQAYDYQSVISDTSRDLAQAAGREELGRLVVDALCQRMSLAGAALLTLEDGAGQLLLEECSVILVDSFAAVALPVGCPLVSLLQVESRPLKSEVLRQRLGRTKLSDTEAALTCDDHLALWAAIEVHGKLRGIVVLGNKLHDALFSQDDLAIVATLARQIGVGMENADLYDSLRAEMRKLQEMQNQLVQAEKLSAVGELVSGVAHELNNPLTAVIGYAELLRAEITDENYRKDLDNILRSAERSMRIVRNLLTFARRQKTERRMVDLNELIQQTVEIQAYQLRVDNIKVELDLDETLPHTAADGAQLQQVLLNIVMNAHQAIHSGRDRGLITIRTRRKGDETLQVTVKDDGPGIPADVISRIFDPFFTTKEVGVGTGLGLSICYGIVHGHGGRIWCESELGYGAAFNVELPVVRMRTEVEASDIPAPDPTPGMRVLVVEDETAVAAVLQRLLVKRGCKVSVANSGVEALRLVSGQSFDAIISDIRMPEMGGIALWENLRNDYPELASRVIFVTGDTANADTSEFLKNAGQPILPKPFGAEDLAKAINLLQARVGPKGN